MGGSRWCGPFHWMWFMIIGMVQVRAVQRVADRSSSASRETGADSVTSALRSTPDAGRRVRDRGVKTWHHRRVRVMIEDFAHRSLQISLRGPWQMQSATSSYRRDARRDRGAMPYTASDLCCQKKVCTREIAEEALQGDGVSIQGRVKRSELQKVVVVTLSSGCEVRKLGIPAF
ncbi:hypothetical protein GY45DRAFT_310516 [Cubamyces sp. BRFM 1775]|nr:hypothetical protein GY45DRAFT_310516 [Cubamyces sp. BRFM 1775]